MTQSWLTTTDNPYNPFTHFTEWYRTDINNGYNTCSYIARLANTSSDLSEAENQDSINRAVDAILRINTTGRYKKIILNDEDDKDDEDKTFNTGLEFSS